MGLLFVLVVSIIIPFIIVAFVGKILGLYKSADDRVLAGVCGGVAERFGVSAGLIRVIWLLAVLLFGQGLAWYIAFAIVLPTDYHHKKYDNDY